MLNKLRPTLHISLIRLSRRLHSTPLKLLNIAYFGSDHFSVKVLDKLVEYKNTKSDSIDRLDIVTRSIKPTGRKLSKFVDLPIGEYGSKAGLNVIRADSSSEINDLLETHNFDLAIAVSYGKLIPQKFLQSLKYGGINVHPSLLPRYAGSSPMQYTLMNDDKYTGVTIQTLHPTKFDKGEIIVQSEEILIEENENMKTLEDKLATKGAAMLIDVLDKCLFKNFRAVRSRYEPSRAPKITSLTFKIVWEKYLSRRIERLVDALGSVYSFKYCEVERKKKKYLGLKKVIFEDVKAEELQGLILGKPGEFELDEASNRIIIKTQDGTISVGSLKFECCSRENATEFMKHLKKRAGYTDNIFNT